MKILLIILSTLLVFLNIGVDNTMSLASPIALILEHFGVLLLCYLFTNKILKKTSHTDKHKFYLFFLVSYFISLFFLRIAWTPNLSPNNPNWGFDPQRYYYYAFNYVKNGYATFGLNYDGIVDFYKWIFKIFGADPLVPLYVNNLLVYITVLYLSNTLFRITGRNVKYFWWLLLVPEVVYFNMMPSRETLCCSCICIATCSFIKYNVQKDNRLVDILIFVFSLLFLAYLRPPFAMALLLAVLICVLVLNKDISFFQKALILSSLLAVFFVTIALYDGLNFAERIDSAVMGENTASEDFTYSANSVTLKLIPTNSVTFVIYGLIRTLLYFVPGLGLITAFFMDPYNFASSVSQEYTSLFLMISLPLLFKLITVTRKKKIYPISVLYITFLIFCLIVGVFNTTMVHHRYRVAYDIVYFSLVIWGINYFNKRELSQLMRKGVLCGLLLYALILALKFM